MCYSAMVQQNAKKLGLRWQARLQLDLYENLFLRRLNGEKVKIKKAMEAPFLKDPQSPAEKRIAKAIEKWREEQVPILQEEMFKQKKRLADAERKLKEKVTKKAQEDIRISSNKIDTCKRKLKDLEASSISDSDQRIYPFEYVSMVHLDDAGKVVVSPVRYHMRPHDEKESFDREKEGAYNARVKNLKRVNFWKDSLEKRRGFVLVKKFFENVSAEEYVKRGNKLPASMKGRENIVICFDPGLDDYFVVPVIWDRWPDKGEPEFLSAAIITDEPLPEVAAAGHDRTPISLKESAAIDWISAKGADEALSVLNGNREHLTFAHEIVGAA